jgi:hypothetical protein
MDSRETSRAEIGRSDPSKQKDENAHHVNVGVLARCGWIEVSGPRRKENQIPFSAKQVPNRISDDAGESPLWRTDRNREHPAEPVNSFIQLRSSRAAPNFGFT